MKNLFYEGVASQREEGFFVDYHNLLLLFVLTRLIISGGNFRIIEIS